MCVEASPRTKSHTGGCGCGGHGRQKPSAAAREILEMQLSPPAAHKCDCDKRRCPRTYLTWSGYVLGIAAAVYHLANGVATGAEVLGWVEMPAAQRRLWRTSLAAGTILLLVGVAAWFALFPTTT